MWLNKGNTEFTVLNNFGSQDGTLSGYVPILADFNGGGKTGIVWDRRDDGDTRSKGTRVLWTSDGVIPDILTGVTTGIGATASFIFKSLTDNTVYTKDNSAADPIIDLQGSSRVVWRVGQSNGIGGIRTVEYHYTGAKAHLDGRGFLGFREVRTTDLGTGLLQATTYRQEYPLAGLVAEEVKSKDGVTLGSSVNTHNAADVGGTRRQVTLTQSVSTGADLDGTVLPSSTTAYQYDAFGNATQITVTSSDGYSKVTTNTYANDTANWLLGRLGGATVTSQAPTVAQQAPPVADATPNAFDFTDLTNAPLNTPSESSAVVTGFTGLIVATASEGGAQIRKNGVGAWGSSAGLNAGDTLNIRMTSSGSYVTAVVATITVGTVSADWQITTLHDTTPNPFDFADLINIPLSALQETSTVLSGFTGSLTATISGADAQLRKNGGGAWGSSVGVIPGDTLNIRMTSSSANSTAVTAVVTVGTVTADWRITTVAPSCGGSLIGGYCWYYGAQGQSCDTVCGSHGGCNLTGTRDYAGSGGTAQNCQNVAASFGVSGTLPIGAPASGLGCMAVLGSVSRASSPATTCNAAGSFIRRFCACSN